MVTVLLLLRFSIRRNAQTTTASAVALRVASEKRESPYTVLGLAVGMCADVAAGTAAAASTVCSFAPRVGPGARGHSSGRIIVFWTAF